jgi:tRNA(Ile)-lysidine synthase
MSSPVADERREAWRGIDRREVWVSRAIARWRELTGGERTLVACSGGADSVGLLLVLRAATEDLVVGHVAHDLRPREAVEADRACAREAARICGVPFMTLDVRVPTGNVEAEARRMRYAALVQMAAASGRRFVASGHHAGDQFEGIVMALVRGAGVRGLGGARALREIGCPESGARATLVRPALTVEPASLRAACVACGVRWSEDATNRDVDRDRAFLRHGALAEIARMRPGAATRAARSAEVLRDAAGLVEDRAREVFGDRLEWDRERLRAERAVVIAAGLRAAFAHAAGGVGLDRLSGGMLDAVTEAIRSSSGEAKNFDWPRNVRVVVGRERVSVTRAERRAGARPPMV